MKKSIIALIGLLIGFSSVYAEETPIKNLYNYKLKNGLDLYVAENHTVPLVYIEIAVHAGGIAQTPENAGLFHLYEHMMFKGNKKYPSSEAMKEGMAALGVSSYNGGTSDEYVNYFFTIPSNKLEEGLDFWNYAVRTPKMDKREFEAEKKVVLSEINGRKNSPEDVQNRAFLKTLFPENPWKGDPAGSPEIVENATIAQLKKIQSEYYIPNNTALLVGGDVNPDEVYALVNKIYGSWKKGADPWKKNNVQYSQTPLAKDEYFVYANEQLSDDLAVISVFYRGPDAEYDEEETYPADLLFSCVNNPSSYYLQSLVNNPNLAIPDQRYTGIYYSTKRKLGVISAVAYIMQPSQYLTQRVQIFADQIPSLLQKTIEDADSEYSKQIEIVKQKMMNDTLFEQETADSLLGQVDYWWIHNNVDYYYTYSQKVCESSNEDVKNFLNKYIIGKNRMISVSVSPNVYEQNKKFFEEAGYKVVTSENTDLYQSVEE